MEGFEGEEGRGVKIKHMMLGLNDARGSMQSRPAPYDFISFTNWIVTVVKIFRYA